MKSNRKSRWLIMVLQWLTSQDLYGFWSHNEESEMLHSVWIAHYIAFRFGVKRKKPRQRMTRLCGLQQTFVGAIGFDPSQKCFLGNPLEHLGLAGARLPWICAGGQGVPVSTFHSVGKSLSNSLHHMLKRSRSWPALFSSVFWRMITILLGFPWVGLLVKKDVIRSGMLWE